MYPDLMALTETAFVTHLAGGPTNAHKLQLNALINQPGMFECRYLVDTGFAGYVRPFGWQPATQTAGHPKL